MLEPPKAHSFCSVASFRTPAFKAAGVVGSRMCNRKVELYAGDATLELTPQEIATAVRELLPAS